jgi:hypothetical protein
MEIKLVCSCGTKFKFEVEPVHGRMPAPVYCPACNADATAEANEVLRQMYSTPQPESVAAPVATPAGGGLRINRPETHAPPPPLPPPPATIYVPAEVTLAPPVDPDAKKMRVMGIVAAVVAIALLGLGGWRIGKRIYRGVKGVAEIASVIKELSNTNIPQSNFWYEDAAIVFVRHTNHMEIADACKTYWKDKLHKNLTVFDPGGQEVERDYELIPAHNGYIRIIGSPEWPAQQFEGLSLYLSQRFKTLVFEAQDQDLEGNSHFGVYEQGARKFHARIEFKMVNGEAEQKVIVENKEWAIANGYKPGENGFDDFYLDDADEITQRLGMKFWDESVDTELKGLAMKENP